MSTNGSDVNQKDGAKNLQIPAESKTLGLHEGKLLLRRANAYFNQEKFDAALSDVTRVIMQFPREVEPYFYRTKI